MRHTKRSFWERVQEALVDAGLPNTQAAAGRLIGISQPSVHEWSKIDGYPTIANARTLALKLGVCVEWLYTERGPKRPPPVDATAQRLWEIWPRLDDVSKGEILGRAIERAEPPHPDGAAEPKSA